jgi:ELWxxDGT repeat protein
MIERLEPRQLLSASMVKDINTGPPQLNGFNGAVGAGDTVFLSQEDGVAGWELYKTDGTTGGTVLVKDIRPGRDNSQPGWLTHAGSGTIYFAADNGTNGKELWRSDGTEAGTVMVKDINPGAGASNPGSLVMVGSTLFFSADNGASGAELWKSDGTEAGTVLVKDINPGTSGFPATPLSSSPSQLINNNGTLFFRATTSASGFELWKSDGTEAGTVMVRDLIGGFSNGMPNANTSMAVLNGYVYFRGSTGTEALWKSDGTSAGTTQIGVGTPTNIRASGTSIYYTVSASPNTGLWWTDGTAAATNIRPESIVGFADVNGTFFFGAGGTLYSAVGGTVSTVRTGMTFNNLFASTWAGVNGTLYFPAHDGSGTGDELWKSDGTALGTVLLKDIDPGPAGSAPVGFTPIGAGGAGGVIFGTLLGGSGRGIYKTDGTPAGTVLLKNINSSTADSSPILFTPFKDRIYFTAFDTTHTTATTGGPELFRTDGTEAGTDIFVDLNPGPLGSSMSSLKVFGNNLFFAANDGSGIGKELWRTDGTNVGLVKDINLGAADSNPGTGVVSGSYMYFTATTATHGLELWRTDGSDSGTLRMTNNAGNVNIFNQTDVNGRLYFTVHTAPSGPFTGLWWSEGLGSSGVATSFTNVASMINVGGTLYIAGTTSANGSRLFKIGPGDTAPVLVPNPLDTSSPANLTEMNGTLYFSATTNSTGTELFKVDPATGEIVLVKNIRGGSSSSSPALMVGANGVLYFRADDGVVGQELWRSDGTDAGTYLLKDINPGTIPGSFPTAPANGSLARLFAANGYVYFAADDGVNGLEGWRTDGTTAGTAMIGDFYPEGSSLNQPSNFAFQAALNGEVYYRFSDETHGFELWKAEQPDFATLGAGGALTIAATGGDDVIDIAADGGGTVVVTLNGLVETFTPGQVASVNVVGHTGSDTLTVSAGTVAFHGDAGAGTDNLTLRVAPGASAIFNASQHLRHLDVDGDATLSQGGAKVIITRGLSVDGRLNLSDNDLVLDYDESDLNPIAAVQARIASAYNFSSWDGPGIYTDMPEATGGLTTLAIADPFSIFGLGPSDTMEFSGVTVDGTSVLIKYTYAGDLDLNGFIDAADYGLIDNWVQFPGTTGYANGDFNFDGLIDAADYGVIDNSIQLQFGPL